MDYKLKKKVGVAVLVVLVFLGLMASLAILTNFPEYYPDETLIMEKRLGDFFSRVTLPIKIARLSLQEPDRELFMPVYGIRVREVSDSWQAPRPDERSHEGQDVFASRGTPVFSATAGYVTRIGNGDLGGNFVSVAGAGGRRYYYAHLDRVADGLKRGQAVSTDTVIGFVGNTGNAETTPPHLHFGVYVSRTAINPLPFLVDRR